MPLAGVCAGTPRRQRFRRYDASLLPRPRFLPGTVPNAACQTSSETRLYAAYRRLHGHSAPAAFSSVRRIATPRLRFVRRNPKCSLPGFFQGTAVCRLQAFAMGFSRSTAFSSVQQLLPRPRFLPGAVPNVACQISSKVRPYTVRRRLHGHSAPGSVFVGKTRPRLCFVRWVPSAACGTFSEARLYAARRRLRGHSAPAAFSSVRRIATPPSSLFARHSPKCGLPNFFRDTAVCRLQAFARAFRAGSVFVGTTHRYSPSSLCQAQSQMQLARLLPRHGRMPLTGVCTGIPRPAAFSSAQRAAFPSFSCSRQNAISRGPPLFPHCSSMARVGGRMFYESTQKCRWFRHAATIPAKGHLRVISNLGSAEMALAKALPDADGRCGKQKTASTLCCEGNSDGHCRPPGSRRNGRFPVHALPALPNRSSFSVTARFMASRARQTPSV